MQKFKDVNELVNKLKPDYPVYCIRPESIKISTEFFRKNFPGKVLYAVKTNPNEKILKNIIANKINDFWDLNVKEIKKLKTNAYKKWKNEFNSDVNYDLFAKRITY